MTARLWRRRPCRRGRPPGGRAGAGARGANERRTLSRRPRV